MEVIGTKVSRHDPDPARPRSRTAELCTRKSLILRMVMEAKTPADHEAIASYYEKQAAENEAQAANHRELAATYRQFHNTNKNMMAPHCEIMADSYAKIAAEDSALAQGHRKLAQSAK